MQHDLLVSLVKISCRTIGSSPVGGRKNPLCYEKEVLRVNDKVGMRHNWSGIWLLNPGISKLPAEGICILTSPLYSIYVGYCIQRAYLRAQQYSICCTFGISDKHNKLWSMPISVGLLRHVNTQKIHFPTGVFASYFQHSPLFVVCALVYSCCTSVSSKAHASTCHFPHILVFHCSASNREQVLSSNCEVGKTKNNKAGQHKSFFLKKELE